MSFKEPFLHKSLRNGYVKDMFGTT